jgi:hypothetical protein
MNDLPINTNVKQFEKFKLSKTKVDFTELAEFYDQLAEISNDEIIGKWKGGYIKSGSLIDLSLTDLGFYGWIGKYFYSDDKVCALMHKFFGLEFNMPIIGNARIREVRFRGKVSTAMIYNHLPIIDHFRRVDENTLMGAMDLKGKVVLYFYLYQ